MKELKILLSFIEAESVISDFLSVTEDFDNAMFLATVFTAIETRFDHKIDGLHDKLIDVVTFLIDAGVDMENTN